MPGPLEPSDARLLELHARLLAGDRAALGELWSLLWSPFCSLGRTSPRATADAVTDAVTDAMLAYAKQPAAFDPTKGSLDSFVYGIARRLLRDDTRAHERRSARESAAASILDLYRRLTADDVISNVAKGELRSALLLVCRLPELAAIKAHLDGADTAVVAARLGLDHLQPAEQRNAVRGLWKAVIKRLKRRLRAPPPRRALVEKSERPAAQTALRRLIHDENSGVRRCRHGGAARVSAWAYVREEPRRQAGCPAGLA